jgi:hypothetical protein
VDNHAEKLVAVVKLLSAVSDVGSSYTAHRLLRQGGLSPGEYPRAHYPLANIRYAYLYTRVHH